MMKSYVKELSVVYAKLFRDLTCTFPALSSEFDRDQARLTALVESRGINVFVVYLPALGKHLDRCLSSRRYTLLENNHISGLVSKKVQVPKFLRGLYLRVFNESGTLKEDYDVEAVYFLRQFCLLASKASLDCSTEATRTEVRELISVDLCLPRPERFWSTIGPPASEIARRFRGFSKSKHFTAAGRRIDSRRKGSPRGNCAGEREALVDSSPSSTLLAILDVVSRLVSCGLGHYDPRNHTFRHGPGAVADLPSKANKYYWRSWGDRLGHVYPIADYGFHSYSSWAANAADFDASSQTDQEAIGSDEPAARLVSVPKTYTKPRLIAAEPCAHQWCQQSIWHYFRTRTESSWIGKFVRFTDQTLNQELSLKGSLDGSLCTVDLSSASDRVSCTAVGNLFRSNQPLLLALQATRTRFLRQELDSSSPELIELRKFSTMGNATTFPVESLMFLSIALSACLAARRLEPTVKNILTLVGEVTVFGDDIVIPNDCREQLFDLLEICDFKVNLQKSFWEGPFRESCGVDSIDGVDVTPVRWMRPNTGKPEEIVSMVEVTNRFYQKFLLNVANYLDSTVQRHRVSLLPVSSNAFGLKSFVSPSLSDLESRWNDDLQRIEYLLLTPIGKQKRTPIEDDSALLQYFTEAPQPHVVWKGGVGQRPSLHMKRRWVPYADLACSVETA